MDRLLSYGYPGLVRESSTLGLEKESEIRLKGAVRRGGHCLRKLVHRWSAMAIYNEPSIPIKYIPRSMRPHCVGQCTLPLCRIVISHRKLSYRNSCEQRRVRSLSMRELRVEVKSKVVVYAQNT